MDTDLRQSEGWAKYLKSQGWVIEELGKTKVFIRKIPLLGSVIKIQRPAEIPSVKEIDSLARRHRALFVKLEPSTEIRRPIGFEWDPNPNLPTKTLVVDLNGSEENLWKDLSKDVRQSIRKAEESKLRVEHYELGDSEFEEELKSFHILLKETGKRQKFWTPRFDQLKEKAVAFGKNATLFIVYAESQTPVAGALVLNSDGTHSASSQNGRKLYAPYLLLWETIRYLKEHKKLSYHDLAGIYDPRFHQATKNWQGFTAFKRKFGGREVTYPRPFIKYYSWIIKILSLIAQL